MIAIRSKYIYTNKEGQWIDGYVCIDGNSIHQLIPYEQREDFPQLMKAEDVYDFTDNLVLPGFCDFHVHLINSATIELDGDLRTAASEEEAARMLWERNKSKTKEQWVLGGAWDDILWNTSKEPSKAALDQYFPDVPVFALNKECHGAWVNSKTLEIFHITKETPDPPNGRISRDEEGNPAGYLHETAMFEVQKKIFERMSDEEVANYAKVFIKTANRCGITSLGDVVGVCPIRPEAYKYLEDSGGLNARIFFYVELEKPLKEVHELQRKYSSSMLKCCGVKAFIDGTPQGDSGYMLEGYWDNPKEKGTPMIDPDRFLELVKTFHKGDVQMRIHACGDAGVRLCLDSFETAQNLYGRKDLRHCIEHIEVTTPEDIPRFGELGVIASVQPEHLPKYDFVEHPFHKKLGPIRMNYSWPFESIRKGGGVLAYGTDSPVAPLDPWRGIFRAVNRLTNQLQPQGGWNPKERVSVEESVKAYTYGGIFAAGMEERLGTLEAGKLADMVVLDKNIFQICHDRDQMFHVKPLLTMVDGRIVYEEEKG